MHDKDKDKDKERSHILLSCIYCCWENASSNYLSRFLSSQMCKQLWDMSKTPNSHKLWYLQEEKDKQVLSARTKNPEFLKTGGNNLQSQHFAASSSLYANIFKFSRHIPDVCYIFFVKLKIPLDFDLISCENFMSETDTSKLRPTFQFPAFLKRFLYFFRNYFQTFEWISGFCS